ncbi:MAG: polyprenyl synthetase family protein [Bacteroidota bacterium]
MKKIQRTIHKTELQTLLQFNREVWQPLQQKLERISVRSSFATWVYGYYLEAGLAPEGHDEQIFRSIIPLTAEFVIAHAYLFNQVFDRKYKIVNKEQINKNISQANLLETHFDQYILEHPRLNSRQKNLIHSSTNRMKIAIHKGQDLTHHTTLDLIAHKRLTHLLIDEQNITNLFSNQFFAQFFDHAKAKSSLDMHLALYSYYARCFLISTDLFLRIVALISDLLEIPVVNETRKTIRAFAERYGFMLQIVNDNSDFFYERQTNYKLSTDVLSDIRNGTYTFPLILHMNTPESKNKLVKRLFFQQNQPSLFGKHNLVLKEMMESQALRESIRLGRRIGQSAKTLLNQEFSAGRRLAKLTEISNNNRYYHHYFKAKDFYRKSSNRDLLYRCENHTFGTS